MTENLGGRPTVMTPEVVNKLEEAFSRGMNDLDACYYAGISKPTLYKYQDEHPEFADRKIALKNLPSVQAIKNVIEGINEGDKSDSKWWLERTNPEFNPKKTTDVNLGGQPNNPLTVTVVTPD